MNTNEFNTDKWNKIKKIEFLRRGGPHWMCDFTEAFKKMKEHEEYNRVWELIKKKNGW